METNSQTTDKKVLNLARNIDLLILDVDGVLTDGSIIYSNDGSETKHFNVRDGLGIKLLKQAGVDVAIITGRHSALVEKRASELKIKHLMQARDDKLQASLELSRATGIPQEKIAFMGDDLPDLAAIVNLGFGITVNSASSIMKENADFVTTLDGGKGAVREVCELILNAKGKLDEIFQRYAEGIAKI